MYTERRTEGTNEDGVAAAASGGLQMLLAGRERAGGAQVLTGSSGDCGGKKS